MAVTNITLTDFMSPPVFGDRGKLNFAARGWKIFFDVKKAAPPKGARPVENRRPMRVRLSAFAFRY
jgi:hypothetical protein